MPGGWEGGTHGFGGAGTAFDALDRQTDAAIRARTFHRGLDRLACAIGGWSEAEQCTANGASIGVQWASRLTKALLALGRRAEGLTLT